MNNSPKCTALRYENKIYFNVTAFNSLSSFTNPRSFSCHFYLHIKSSTDGMLL